MHAQNEVTERTKSPEVAFSDDALGTAWRIEEVLSRAHEIHRARGGLFGYDLEDWLEAERELAERNRPAGYQVEDAARVEPLSFNRERIRQKCFGADN